MTIRRSMFKNFYRIILTLGLCLVASKSLAEVRTTSNGEEIGILIIGTIVHSNNKENVALVKEIEGSRVKAVKIGFRLLNKYTVSEVQTKYIILQSAQNDLHVIYQDKFASDFLPRKKNIQGTAQSYVGGDSYSEDGFERKGDKVSMTAAFRDKVVEQDLAKILMQATAVPNYEGGALKGFRLLQIDKGSIFDNSGMIDDDIITAINGTPLTTVPGTIKQLHSLKKEASIQIEFMRGGAYKTISVNVD